MAGQIDSQEFRRAMGHFASGVTVVTALAGEEPRGMTASAFSSLSLEPPLVLVCVARSAAFCEVISSAAHFGVNLLAHDQQELSQRFASRAEKKFDGLEAVTGATGVPLLPGALAQIECSRYDLLPGGDHVIVVGRVENLTVNGGEPLTYFAGRYRWLRPAE